MSKTRILTGMSIMLMLTGCDSVKSSLGMDHYQADEFNIKQNESLTMPPNYTLMPPRTKDKDGKSLPLNPSAQKAQQVVGGGQVQGDISEASRNDLKSKVGTQDDSIRKTVDKEAAEEGDSAVDKKLSAWKKEFTKNANSINDSKDAPKKPGAETPVEKIKEEYAKTSNDHEDSLETKIEYDLAERAQRESAEKNQLDVERIAEGTKY